MSPSAVVETRFTDNNMTHTPEHTPVSYTNEDAALGAMSAEPSMHEVIHKRRFPLAEAMKTSITLEESRRLMEERVYKFYHPEA